MRRPWAELVVSGRKTLETRVGPVLSRYRGEIAIHVSARSPGWQEALAHLVRRFDLRPHHYTPPISSIDGCVIGMVRVVGCWREGMPQLFRTDSLDDIRDRGVFEDVEGRYLADLRDPRWLDAPVPAKGSLGLWEWTP